MKCCAAPCPAPVNWRLTGYRIQCETCGSSHTRAHGRKADAWAEFLNQLERTSADEITASLMRRFEGEYSYLFKDQGRMS